ncbi:MAG: hypothetical protein Q9218_008138, partial [Villophora microphyllina]
MELEVRNHPKGNFCEIKDPSSTWSDPRWFNTHLRILRRKSTDPHEEIDKRFPIFGYVYTCDNRDWPMVCGMNYAGVLEKMAKNMRVLEDLELVLRTREEILTSLAK